MVVLGAGIWEGGLMMGLVPLIFNKKRHERAYFSFILSLSCKNIKRRLLPVNHKEGSHQTPTLWAPWSGLPNIQNCGNNKPLFLKPHSPWYLVTAATPTYLACAAGCTQKLFPTHMVLCIRCVCPCFYLLLLFCPMPILSTAWAAYTDSSTLSRSVNNLLCTPFSGLSLSPHLAQSVYES